MAIENFVDSVGHVSASLLSLSLSLSLLLTDTHTHTHKNRHTHTHTHTNRHTQGLTLLRHMGEAKIAV